MTLVCVHSPYYELVRVVISSLQPAEPPERETQRACFCWFVLVLEIVHTICVATALPNPSSVKFTRPFSDNGTACTVMDTDARVGVRPLRRGLFGGPVVPVFHAWNVFADVNANRFVNNPFSDTCEGCV